MTVSARSVLSASVVWLVGPVTANSDVTLDVSWPSFLARHDMLWRWDWGAGATYSLQPINRELDHCGTGDSAGDCCLAASADGGSPVTLELCSPESADQQWQLEPNGTVVSVGTGHCLDMAGKADQTATGLSSYFSGNFQIGLSETIGWGCSSTADPPMQCCLPVPGQAMSGCHVPNEKRWHCNQFFAFPAKTASASSFTLATMDDNTMCAQANGASYGGGSCVAGNTAQEWGLVMQPSGAAMIKNSKTGSCITTSDHEAGTVKMSACTPGPTNVFEPLCDTPGLELLPGWKCVARTPAPPAPPSPPHPGPAPAPHPSPPPPPKSGNVVTSPCTASSPSWGEFEGFWMPGQVKGSTTTEKDGPDPRSTCLQVGVPSSFCDSTICPTSFTTDFKAGQNLTVQTCQNGDRSQMLTAYTIPKAGTAARQNFIPLTWAVSAYTGNGLIGVRVQSEEGGVGVLHVLIDNVELGALAKRKPNGYFRFRIADGNQGNLAVSLRTHIATSLLEGNVTDDSGQVLTSFSVFVNADLALPVVVLQANSTKAMVGAPALEWVSTGKTDFAWANKTAPSGTSLTAWASVQAPGAKLNATQVVATAAAIEPDILMAKTFGWWATYWAQTFVSVPVTRAEGFYYAEMFRFPASDRVVLQGLMGAFGPTDNYNLWPDDVWDMNEQVMYWLGTASNRPEITDTLTRWFESGGNNGGLWMVHNYVKTARFAGNDTKLVKYAWPVIVSSVMDQAGKAQAAPGSLKLLQDGIYHIVGCNSPEYKCYPPFQSRACSPKQDCNFALSQLRWGLQTALELADEFPELAADLKQRGIATRWWQVLLAGKLAWYPYDDVTGFRLDANCAFECPHRHFSHLLQVFDLETVVYDTSPQGNATVNTIIHNGVDNWYRVTCNQSNWFNEECRGFTQCGLASMSAVSGRPEAAEGNLTGLIDSVVTPNAMYGEMVYQAHPNEFGPVSESAYCGAGVIHTMYLHTNPATKVLSLFPGLTWPNASFHLLAADGGLLVSASRTAGSTAFLRIFSKKARNVTIKMPNDPAWAGGSGGGQAPKASSATVVVTSRGHGMWTFVLAAESAVVLYTSGAPPFVIQPVPSNTTEENWFGYTRQMQPLH